MQISASPCVTAIRRLSGLNLAEPRHGAGVVQYGHAAVDVPDREVEFGVIRRHQVAAVGTETKHEDIAIAPGLEAGDLLIISDALDLDRPSRNRRA